MSNGENNTVATGATTSTEQDGQAKLQEAVNLASDLLVLARDQKNTGIAALTAPPEEIAAVQSFIARGRQQQTASKQIYALSLAKAKERNAGRKVPPSRQKKTGKGAPAAS
jgi:hypothetical protein